MAKITICINENYIKKNGNASIFMRVFIDNKYIRVNLNIDIEPKFFDKNKGLIVGGERKKENNLLIKENVGRAADIILRYRVQKKTLTEENFLKEFTSPDFSKDFVGFWEKEITERSADLGSGTIRGQRSVLEKFKEFKPEIAFCDLSEKVMIEFQRFMKKKKDNDTNTIHNAFKIIRTYVNIAKKEGLIEKSPFDTFKPKKAKTYPVFLTDDELQRLIDLYDSETLTDKYQRTLRLFLFSCFTGVRISDAKAMKFENVRNNTLDFLPLKTEGCGTRVTMPLCKVAMQMIKDENKFGAYGIIFQTEHENTINERLKFIAFKEKITKNLHFHSARHTFATRFLRKTKTSSGIFLLQKLLGHATLQSTLIYTHILDDDIREAMLDFDK